MKKRLCMLLSCAMIGALMCGCDSGTTTTAGESEIMESTDADGDSMIESEIETEAAEPSIAGTWTCIGADLFGSGEITDAETMMKNYELDLAAMVAFYAWDNGKAMLEFTDEGDDEDDSVEGYTMPYTYDGEVWNMIAGGAAVTAQYTEDGNLLLSINEDGDTGAYLFAYAGEAPDTVYGLNFDYDQDQAAEMSRFMNGGNYYVAAPDLIYGYVYSDEPPALGRFDITETDTALEREITILEENAMPSCMTEKDGLLYMILSNGTSDAFKIISLDLATDEITVLVESEDSMDDLNVTDEHLYFTSGESCVMRANLDGSDLTVVKEGALYYYYHLSENWALYQDDPAGEILCISSLVTGDTYELTNVVSYNPVIYQGKLYYVGVIDGSKHLCSFDLSTGDEVIDEFELSNSEFYIFNDKIYLNDGFSADIDQVGHLTENQPMGYVSVTWSYMDSDYYIWSSLFAYSYNKWDDSLESAPLAILE